MMVEMEENSAKRRKSNNRVEQTENIIISNENEPKVERCAICRQNITEISLYNGHPNNSVDEYVALTNEKLLIFTGEESNVHDLDARPTHKV